MPNGTATASPGSRPAGKHPENIYAKVGVTNRASLAAVHSR